MERVMWTVAVKKRGLVEAGGELWARTGVTGKVMGVVGGIEAGEKSRGRGKYVRNKR